MARTRRRAVRQAQETDEQLIARVRAGDGAAYGELYRRYRRPAATVARSLVRRRSDIDDVVSEAFAGVLSAIHNGSGPRDNFRRYLFACVRNGCRVRQPPVPIGDVATGDERRSPPALEDPERYVEADTVARAFASLRPRWQQTLWLTDVEQRPTDEVSRTLEMSPNATAALTLRAREALTTAYLAEHVGAAAEGCTEYAAQLAAFVRGKLTAARRDDVRRHVEGCSYCEKAVAELSDLNACLRSLSSPAALATSGRAVSGMVSSSWAPATPTAASVLGTGSVGSGGWAGALGAGLLVKAAAVSLVVAQVVVSQVEPDDGDVEQAVLAAHFESQVAAAPPSDVNVVIDSVPVPTSAAPAPDPAIDAAPTIDEPRGVNPVDVDAPTTTVIGPPSSAPIGALPPPEGLGSQLLQATGELTSALTAGLDVLLDDVGAIAGEAVGNVNALLAGVERALSSTAALVAAQGTALNVPAVTVPAVSTPAVTVPTVNVPAVSIPLPLPSVPQPALTPPTSAVPSPDPPTTPQLTLPAVTIPALTLPAVTVPSITLPALPEITLPAVTLPDITVPRLTVPDLGLQGFRSVDG